jgi:hypothetical protein
MVVYRTPISDLLTIKETADILRINENKGYQWVEEGALPQVRIADKWLSPRGHIVCWINESVQRERNLLIVGGIIFLSLRFMSIDSGSCFGEGRR